MSPRFGYRTSCLTGWTAEQAAVELARLGYDCLELCLEPPDVRPERLDAARCAELKQVFEDAGIAVASLSYHGDEEAPAERLENHVRAVEAAARLGAPILVLNSERDVDHERQWEAHVSHLRRICRLAGDAAVDIAVEPEPRLVIGSSQDMVEMLRAVGSLHLKVNLDIGHAQCTDDDLAGSIRLLGPAVVHLHLEDIKDRVHRHLMFGEGDINFPAVREALAGIHFTGPYVADLFGQANPPRAAEQALGAMRSLFA